MPLTHVHSRDLEKDVSQQIDDVAMSEKDEKSSGAVGGDYSGAIAKSNPQEIALVRKLDTRIMPTLFCMYFL
jgi:hypothetical protein